MTSNLGSHIIQERFDAAQRDKDDNIDFETFRKPKKKFSDY